MEVYDLFIIVLLLPVVVAWANLWGGAVLWVWKETRPVRGQTQAWLLITTVALTGFLAALGFAIFLEQTTEPIGGLPLALTAGYLVPFLARVARDYRKETAR